MNETPAGNETLPMNPEDHQRMVQRIAWTYRGQEIDVEDLAEEGQRGLQYALKIGDAAEFWIRHSIRSALVARHKGLVYGVALKYRNRGVEIEDLSQEGQFGLLRAMEMFDPDRGKKFSTYATWWIRNFCRMAVVNHSHIIRVPNYLHEAIYRGDTPDTPGLTENRRATLGMAIELRARRVVGSCDLVEVVLADLVPNRVADFPDDEEVAEVMAAINLLPERSAQILKMRAGMNEGEAATLQVVGDRFSITKERVRQLEREAIAMVRLSLGVDKDGKRKGVGA